LSKPQIAVQGGTDGLTRQPVDSPRGDELPTAGRFVPPFAVGLNARVGTGFKYGLQIRGRFPGTAEPLARLRLARWYLPSDQELYGAITRPSREKKTILESVVEREPISVQKVNGTRARRFFCGGVPFFYTAEKPENSLATQRRGARRGFFTGFLPHAPQPGGGRIRWRSSRLAF
jgi:hypothetical protein